MSISRKDFLAGLGGTVTLLVIGACGGDDDADDAGGGGGGCRSTAITTNHGHSVSIPTADLDSTSAKTYSIRGSATHEHTITLGPADFTKLKAGDSVSTTSSLTTHEHTVTLSCA